MAALVVCLVLFLAMAGHSSATYCICRDGLSDSILQRDIDYACGAGADCTPIAQSGSCYNPNTVKAHCDYAVNSYFQKKGQAVGSCDFSGSATQSATVPTSSQTNGCSYPSTAGTGTTPSTTPSTTPPSTTTPSTGGTTPSTGGTTTPSTGGTTTPSTGGTTTPSTGTSTPSVFGLGPTGSGINTDNSSGATAVTLHQKTTIVLFFTLLLAGFMCWNV